MYFSFIIFLQFIYFADVARNQLYILVSSLEFNITYFRLKGRDWGDAHVSP